MASYILTLDVGTSSLRAILYAADGESQGSALAHTETQIKHQVHATADGGAELDPATLFTNTGKAIDGTLAQLPQGATIAGVATSTLWHSVLGLDRDGNVVTPLYTWADTRAAAAAQQLRERLNERDVHARTGCVLHPSYLPARFTWLAGARPDLWKSVARWVSFGEYLQLRFLGQAICSVSMASGTGLLDVHACAWDEEMLRVAGVTAEQLSPLGDAGDGLQGLRDEWATRWPALKGVPWYPAIGDGACSNVGSDCVVPGRIALMVGTSGAMRVMPAEADAPVVPGLWFYRVDKRRPLIGGALSEGGNIFAWMRDTLRLDALPNLEQEVAAMQPDAHGLTVLPFLAGERSPGWAADARGTISGLDLATRPADILRAALEAISYRFAIVRERLDKVATRNAVVIASGGALLGSPAWMQIMADVLDRRVVASSEHEASSRGAALLAMEGLGLLPDVRQTSTLVGVSYEPDGARHARYEQAIARQAALYRLLVGRGHEG